MDDYVKYLFLFSIYGSILFILFMTIKFFITDKISKKSQYILLIVIMLRFIFIFPINISISNDLPLIKYPAEINRTFKNPINVIDSFSAENPQEKEFAVNETPDTSNNDYSRNSKFRIQNLLYLFPIISLSIFLKHILSYSKFCKELNKTLQYPNEELAESFKSAKNEMHIKSNVKIFESSFIDSPMLIGFIFPKIIIPCEDFKKSELKNILLHELNHFRQKDILLKWLMTFAVSIHFFNPIIYLLRKELNRFCELSCDESVVKSMKAEDKQLYGETLIKIAANNSIYRNVGFNMMCEEKKSLKGRLFSIMKYKNKSALIFILSFVLIVLASSLTILASLVGSDDYEDIYKQAKIVRENSKWNSFLTNLETENLLPAEIINKVNADIESPYTDNFFWMEKNGTGLGISIEIRADELRFYEYRNGGGSGYIENSNPISIEEALDKASNFLKTYGISSNKLENILFGNYTFEQKISKANISISDITAQKSPNYKLTEIRFDFSDEEKYLFVVDLNMGGIIIYQNEYLEKVAVRDIRVGYTNILNGRDYLDKIKDDEVFLWTNKKGDVLDVNYENCLSKRVNFKSKAEFLDALKLSNNGIYFPTKLKFNEASIEYCLTNENVDYKKPLQRLEIKKDLFLNIYKIKGDYKSNIKEIIVFEEGSNDSFSYRMHLINDERNFYSMHDQEFKLSDEKEDKNNTETKEVAISSDFPEPEENISVIKSDIFDRAYSIEKYAENDTQYSIYLVKKIKEFECFDAYYSFETPSTAEFTGMEIMLFGNENLDEIYNSLELIK